VTELGRFYHWKRVDLVPLLIDYWTVTVYSVNPQSQVMLNTADR